MILGLVLIIAALYMYTGDIVGIIGGHRRVPITNLLDMPDEIPAIENGEVVMVHRTKVGKYESPGSDRQIQTIVRSGSAGDYARLIQVVAKFYRGRVQDIPRLLNKRDSEIYSELRRQYPRDNVDPTRRDLNQAECMGRNLKGYIKEPGVYLDIGCNRGGITRELGRIIGAKRVVGVDVVDPKVVSGIEYHQIDTLGKLPLPDASVDLITANMTLHHVEHLDVLAREISRVLRPGGRLYIREHDCWTVFDAMLIDVEHIMYDRVGGDEGEYNMYHYTNFYGWDKLLEPLHFVKADYYYPSIRNDISPTRAYWAVYSVEPLVKGK